MGLIFNNILKDIRKIFTQYLKYFLLLILIYSPWHDAYTLGQRGTLDFFGRQVALASLVHLGLILLFLVPIAVHVYALNKKIWIVVVALVAYSLFPIHGKIGNPMTALNFLLVCFSLVFTCQLKNQIAKFSFFKKQNYLVVLFASYFLSIILPMLVPIAGYQPTVHLTPIDRYRGWTGEGQPIAWVGLHLLMLSVVCFLDTQLSKRVRLFSILCITVAVFGIYLNVLRITAYLAIIFLAGVLGYIFKQKSELYFKHNKIPLFSVPIVVIISLIAILQTGQFLLKSSRNCYDGTVFQTSLTKIVEVRKIEDMEKVIVTNGRARTLKLLFEEKNHHWLLGNGSGWSQQFLKDKKNDAVEPNNDYVRILFDWGIVGLLFFIGLIVRAFISLDFLGRIVFFTFALSLLTDAILIIPSFGYLMFFSNLWLRGSQLSEGT